MQAVRDRQPVEREEQAAGDRTGTGGNNQRVIKSKAGHVIAFDDTTDAEQLTIRDKSGSAITMNADGSITVSAKGGLTIRAEDQISLEAAGGETKIVMTRDQVDIT